MVNQDVEMNDLSIVAEMVDAVSCDVEMNDIAIEVVMEEK